ncbi:MAG TPA: VWA domain-containing protein [Thermoanaerobaculia bacterium]|nr:VWA domain-containing protein [Thermoanaerobaculia bacterium]
MRTMRKVQAARAAVAALVVFSVAGLAPAVSAAQPAAAPPAPEPQTRFGEKIEVREVLIDALVTDRKGNVIIGLGKNDFVVRENGKPVELTGVTFYSNRRLLESSDAVAKKRINVDQVPEDRYFILLFDDQKGNAADAPVLLAQQLEAGRRAREWVSRDLLPNDWVAVASYDYKLKIHQDFTHDRKLLQQAVDEAVKGKETEDNWPSRQAAHSGPTLLVGLPTGRELRDRTATIYQALQTLAGAAGKIVGRKNLLLFTIGFGQINPLRQYQPDLRYYPPMMEALNTANTAVYTIDLWPAGSNHTLSDAMNQLANETGGKYFFNFVNFLTPLEQTSKENSGYYLLSYKSEHPAGASGFQEVEVRTTNPELQVRTRKGYSYGAGAATTAAVGGGAGSWAAIPSRSPQSSWVPTSNSPAHTMSLAS